MQCKRRMYVAILKERKRNENSKLLNTEAERKQRCDPLNNQKYTGIYKI
jgi:hypothetical protein